MYTSSWKLALYSHSEANQGIDHKYLRGYHKKAGHLNVLHMVSNKYELWGNFADQVRVSDFMNQSHLELCTRWITRALQTMCVIIVIMGPPSWIETTKCRVLWVLIKADGCPAGHGSKLESQLLTRFPVKLLLDQCDPPNVLV